tara:strand:- start:62 stop:721 length:660 start_codon:yes stop_codon:yes gene_type:complete
MSTENVILPSNIIEISKKTSDLSEIEIKKPSNKILTVYIVISELTNVILHTLLLAIFETIFFWKYISLREKKIIISKLKLFSIALTPICSYFKNLNEDVYLNYINDIQDISNKHNNKLNKEGPYYTSILLVICLFLIYCLFLIITKILINQTKGNKIIKSIPNIIGYIKIDFKRSLICLSFISVYEIIFFQTVVSQFNPINSSDILLKLFSSCIKLNAE